jgi:molybdopterin synthase sulfur carrier subunit
MSKPLQVLYFAWLRDRIGLAEETVTPPASVTTIGALAAWLAAQSDRHAQAFAPGAVIRAAVNQQFADPGTQIAPGDEIAFFPPVTGG